MRRSDGALPVAVFRTALAKSSPTEGAETRPAVPAPDKGRYERQYARWDFDAARAQRGQLALDFAVLLLEARATPTETSVMSFCTLPAGPPPSSGARRAQRRFGEEGILIGSVGSRPTAAGARTDRRARANVLVRLLCAISALIRSMRSRRVGYGVFGLPSRWLAARRRSSLRQRYGARTLRYRPAGCQAAYPAGGLVLGEYACTGVATVAQGHGFARHPAVFLQSTNDGPVAA